MRDDAYSNVDYDSFGSIDRLTDYSLEEGTDYGCLSNSKKKCLFKSGAEKVAKELSLACKFEIAGSIESFSEGLFHYNVKAILVERDTGLLAGEGLGSCNSMESKYDKTKKPNIANTVLKMAKKRAFVDAVLITSGLSGEFTQDLEERDLGSSGDDFEEDKTDKTGEKQERISEKQQAFIYNLLSKSKTSVEQSRAMLNAKYGKTDITNLSKKEASEYIAYLREKVA